MSSARKASAIATQKPDGNRKPEAKSSSDRLSHLPESIIYHIFSFLDPNRTVHLSLVSKKFKELCFRSPYLHFLADFDRDYKREFLYVREEKELKTKYTQFCHYVDKVMRSRDSQNIEIDRFVIHWFSKALVKEGCQVMTPWVRFATNCNVKELDILLRLDSTNKYSLPETVFTCQSLRVLRLNLQMGELDLAQRDMDSIEEVFLDSVTIPGVQFGETISNWWGCLKRLNLSKIHCLDHLLIDSSSLEDLKISRSRFGRPGINWRLAIRSKSLKTACISNCQFITRSKVHVGCLSLENFRIYDSSFERPLLFKVFHAVEYFGISDSDSKEVSSLLECFGVFGSYFCGTCIFCMAYPFVQRINISSCKFDEHCFLNSDNSSWQDLTISDCEIIPPHTKNVNPEGKCSIVINSTTLENLTLNSSDEYLYEFPLSFIAPNLKVIKWRGNPVDFRHLEILPSLEKAVIDIKPACQHKSWELAYRCNLFRSSIYCTAMLLQSLKHVKALKINIWPIEIFFMQNEEPVNLDNLEVLILMADDSLPNQLTVIASFLKGLPNLTTLLIKCEKPSRVLGDPNFINYLGLHSKSSSISLNEDRKILKIQRQIAQAAECPNV